MRVPIFAAIAVCLLSTLAAVRAADEDVEMASVEGEHVILKVRADDMKLLNDPEAWVAKLDRTYEELADLVGAVPFDGEKITILSVDEDPGGWAVAGNPIKWQRRYIPAAFASINKGDWLFGIMHELGHDFDMDGRWVWGAEFWANYKLEYVFYKTKCTVFFDGKVCDYSDPNSPKALDHGVYSELPKEFGWAPIKNVFRWFASLQPDALSREPLCKCSMFMRKLEDETGAELTDRTGDWGDWGGILTVGAPDATAAAKIMHTKDWRADVASHEINAKPGEKVTVRVDVLERKPVTFKKGLGTHPYSEFVYDLAGKYKTFESIVGVPGVDPAEGRWASVCFIVEADGKKVYESPVLYGGGIYKQVSLPVDGVKELKLIVNDGGNGVWGDGCAWVDTKVIDADGTVTYLSDMKPVSTIEGYGGLHLDECIDETPLTFVYNTCEQPVRIVGMVDGEMIRLHQGSDPEAYEYTFDGGFEKGTHTLKLTIRVGDKPITQHEEVAVEVE